MLSRKYFVSLTAIALFFVSAMITFAQTAPTRGAVVLKKADGSETPLAGAVVDVYRTDAKGKPPGTKTDKKGNFAFAGLTLGQVYALVISAPEVRTEVTPNIRAGMDTIKITVYEGDGKPLTEDEVRQSLTVKPKSTGGQTTGQTGTGEQTGEQKTENSEEAKKAKAEYDKKVAEVAAKNEKAKNSNEIVKKSLEEGRTAYDAKNYDLAIVKFDEGINADPDYEGSAPVLLNNKALAYRLRAFDAYSKSRSDAANKDALMEKAKSDFTASIAASQRAIEILNKVTGADANLQKSYDANKYSAYSNIVESHRLLFATKADQTRAKDAADALVAYEAVETVPAQKLRNQLLLANAFRQAGDSANALVIYKRVLEVNPDNADAMGGLGLSLFDQGVSATNKEQMQEGLNYMEKYTQMAPVKSDDSAETKEFKESVRGAVDYLKNTEKLTPQKITTPSKPTNKKKP